MNKYEKSKDPNVIIILYFAGDACNSKGAGDRGVCRCPAVSGSYVWKGDGVNGVVAAKWDLVLMWSWKMTTS